MREGLRIGLVGATGLLGREVIEVLDAERYPLGALQLFAGEASLGEEVEFRGELLDVQMSVEHLSGLDALLVCTPAAVALDWVRIALRSEVPCIDCSGALASSAEVPMAMASLGSYEELLGVPLISSPPGTGLAWAPILATVQREWGLKRVLGTILHSASTAGRGGIQVLSETTLALLNQRGESEAPVDDFAPKPFECFAHGATGQGEKSTDAEAEATLLNVLRRVLGPNVAVAATSVQVPTFAGQGATLALETEKACSPDEAAQIFASAAGVDLVESGRPVGTRESVGGERIQISRLRADPTCEAGRGLLLWLTADPLRLAARNAVCLLDARFPPC